MLRSTLTLVFSDFTLYVIYVALYATKKNHGWSPWGWDQRITGESSKRKRLFLSNIIFVETLFNKNYCPQMKLYFTKFSLLYELHFLMLFFNYFMSIFWDPDLLVKTGYVAGTFWRYKILPPKNKKLPVLYLTRAIFYTNSSVEKFSIEEWPEFNLFLNVWYIFYSTYLKLKFGLS